MLHPRNVIIISGVANNLLLALSPASKNGPAPSLADAEAEGDQSASRDRSRTFNALPLRHRQRPLANNRQSRPGYSGERRQPPPDPTMSWLRQFGTNGADWGYGVDGDNEGNVYVAGAVILMYLLHLWDIASDQPVQHSLESVQRIPTPARLSGDGRRKVLLDRGYLLRRSSNPGDPHRLDHGVQPLAAAGAGVVSEEDCLRGWRRERGVGGAQQNALEVYVNLIRSRRDERDVMKLSGQYLSPAEGRVGVRTDSLAVVVPAIIAGTIEAENLPEAGGIGGRQDDLHRVGVR